MMLEAIILAGGLGTRLKDTVPDVPKPLAPIQGRPFLEHQMDYWIKQGVSRFVLSVGYKREKIIEHFGSNYKGCEISYAQEVDPLGTGGGLLLAVDCLKYDQKFLVLNGDTFFDVEYKTLLEFHKNRESELTVALFEIQGNDRYMGVQINNDGFIESIKSIPGSSQLGNGGVYLMEHKLLENLPWRSGDKLSLEDDLFKLFIKKNKKISGMLSLGRFIDIGIPNDYFRADQVIQGKK